MGKIDNDTYSLSFGLTHQAHSLTFSYQEVNGNEYFDYLHETNGIYLANSLLSDFNGPNEKSFQIAYGLNMAEYGVPGLKFNIYQARGWGIDGTHYTGNGGVRYDGTVDGWRNPLRIRHRRFLRRTERPAEGHHHSRDLHRAPRQRKPG
jgi:hypothetical protein